MDKITVESKVLLGIMPSLPATFSFTRELEELVVRPSYDSNEDAIGFNFFFRTARGLKACLFVMNLRSYVVESCPECPLGSYWAVGSTTGELFCSNCGQLYMDFLRSDFENIMLDEVSLLRALMGIEEGRCEWDTLVELVQVRWKHTPLEAQLVATELSEFASTAKAIVTRLRNTHDLLALLRPEV